MILWAETHRWERWNTSQISEFWDINPESPEINITIYKLRITRKKILQYINSELPDINIARYKFRIKEKVKVTRYKLRIVRRKSMLRDRNSELGIK